MRVLIYNWRDLAHPAAGGAEVWTEMVARGLVRRGHDVTLFAAAVAGRPPVEDVEGVRVVRRGSRLLVYREARKFWRECGDKFDVVLDEINTRPFHTPRFTGRTPVVAIAHQVAREVWFDESHLPVAVLGRYVMEPWWLRDYRDIPTLTLSESSAASLRQYGLRNLHVITPGGEPIARPAVAREDRPTVVFLGRLVPSKRPDHAVRAFEIAKAKHSDAQMWIIGDGPFAAQLRGLGVPDVHLLGRLPLAERNERLARAHVLVATSRREGWGLNVSEAADMGTPAIGYGVCGLVDSISMSGGHVTDETPEALGEALTRFFDGSLTLSACTSTQSWDAVTDAVDRVLQSVDT